MIPPHVLARVPGCADARPPLAIVPLPGGEGRNQILRIDTAEGRFVWRRRLPPVDRPGAVARTEVAAHRHAAAAGLAPAVLCAAADGSWLLMEYVDGAPWSEPALLNAAGAEQLGRRLAALHAIVRPAEVPPADASAMARGYVERVRQRDSAVAAALQPQVLRVAEICAELGGLEEQRVLVHGDLAVNNLLGRGPHLVDWEYAHATDPSWDWACLLCYYPPLEAWMDRLVGPAGTFSKQDRARLRLQRERFALLNDLWRRAYPPVS